MERVTIATKIGGSLETILEDKTGFLVDVGDTDRLAKLLENALSFSEEQAREIGSDARRHIEKNFSNEKMCEDTLNIYRELVS